MTTLRCFGEVGGSVCSGGEEKGENTSAGWDLCLGSFLPASHFKGGTAAKSSRFEEAFQGWPLKECSAFSVPAW